MKKLLLVIVLLSLVAGTAFAARNFDGTNDYLDAGNPSALNLTGDEVTLSAWIKLETTNDEGKIVATIWLKIRYRGISQ